MGDSRLSSRCRRFLLFPLLLGALFFLLPCTTVRAFVPPVESEKDFLHWYETNKNSDNAIYTLKDDLLLTSGTDSSPIRLDGTGRVTIDCGPHLILIRSNVIIDNPHLTIQGNEMYVLMVGYDYSLTLKRGTIRMDGEGAAIAYTSGRGTLVTPKGSDRFTIIARGSDVTGIYYYGDPDVTLTNLDIQTFGINSSKGVNFSMSDGNIQNCKISSSGNSQIFGVIGAKKVGITDSCITAQSTENTAQIYSVLSLQSDDSVSCDTSSVLTPLPPDFEIPQKTYIIREYLQGLPCTLTAGSGFSAGDFPSTVSVTVEEQGTGNRTTISIPVKWDLSRLDTSYPGVSTVPGSFVPDSEECTYVNPDQITPVLSVLCTKDNHIFLAGWKVFHSSDDEIRLSLLMPYPYGANRVTLQYSADGTDFVTYEDRGQENILNPSDTPYASGLWGFAVSLPVNVPRLYLRTVISGGSIYAGTSPVWELDLTSGSGNMPPEYEHGDGGGDRGGQTIDPGSPEGSQTSPAPAAGGSGTAEEYPAQHPPASFPGQQEDETSAGDVPSGPVFVPAASVPAEEGAATPEDSADLPVYRAKQDTAKDHSSSKSSQFIICAALLTAVVLLCTVVIIRLRRYRKDLSC